VQLQGHKLRKRQGQEPDIKYNARHSGGPCQGVDVATFVSIVQPLPQRPEGLDRLALESHGEEKTQVVDDVGNHGVLQYRSSFAPLTHRKDSQTEENDRCPGEESNDGIKKHARVENLLNHVSIPQVA
jgi:hypothetical protein